MIIICGKTIAEVERDLEMAKQAIASGMPYGVGGATIEDAEKGLEMMRAVCGEQNAPISNPNYTPPCGLMSCDHCNYDYCPCDDEDEDTCPECGDYCEDGLSEKDIDRILDALGIPKALYDLVRRELGL